MVANQVGSRKQFLVAAAMATVEQMTSEITILPSQVNEVNPRVQRLEELGGHLFAHIDIKAEGSRNVLTTKGVSDAPTCDGRAETFEYWWFKVKKYVESEGGDSSFFFEDIGDHDDELHHEWMRSFQPRRPQIRDRLVESPIVFVVGPEDHWKPTSNSQESRPECAVPGCHSSRQDCGGGKGSNRKPCPNSLWQDPHPETRRQVVGKCFPRSRVERGGSRSSSETPILGWLM